jgi:hypothetical protein
MKNTFCILMLVVMSMLSLNAAAATSVADTAATVTAANGQLTSDQLFRLKMKALEVENSSIWDSFEDFGIPFTFFLSVIAIVFICLFFLYKDKKRRYDLIAKAIDKGQEIPDMSLLTMKKPRRKNTVFDYIKNGIIFTSLGAMMLGYGWFVRTGTELSGPMVFVGSFFLAFGIAWLLIALLKHNIDKKNAAKQQSTENNNE